MTKRILYHHRYAAFDTGSPKALFNMIAGLDRGKYQPLFLKNADGPLIDALRELDVTFIDGASRAISFRRPLEAMRRISGQRKMLRAQNIDAVHLNDAGWCDDLIIGARLAGIPAVLHVHNSVDFHARNLNMPCATVVLGCSDAILKSAGHYSRIEHKAKVLFNSVDFDKFRGGEKIRSELSLNDTDIVVLTIGQIRKRKGIDLIVEIADQLRQDKTVPFDRIKFLVVGPKVDEREEYWQKIQKMIRDRGLEKTIIFTGSRQDIPDILASSDMFLFPTRWEPFGMVVIEAMAAGLPVIASRIGGIPEILVSDNIGTLVSPVEGSAFAEKLAAILKMPDLGKETGLRGQTFVHQRFDQDTIGKELDEIYSAITK
jgi:glycosyltransferase involved in cell wall biosynthesis